MLSSALTIPFFLNYVGSVDLTDLLQYLSEGANITITTETPSTALTTCNSQLTSQVEAQSVSSCTPAERTAETSGNQENVVKINNTSPFDAPSVSSVVDAAFQLEAAVRAKPKTAGRKRLTSHRLLTSDEIYDQKKKEKEEKELKAKQKEERKRAREIKAQEKNVKKAKKCLAKQPASEPGDRHFSDILFGN